jgi:hypothetical protein
LNLLHDGAASAAALAGGYHLAWLVGAATVLITLVLTMSALRGASSSIEMDGQLDDTEAVA